MGQKPLGKAVSCGRWALDTLCKFCFWEAGCKGEAERLVLVTEFSRNLGAQEPGIKVGVLWTMILREVGGAFIFPGERGLLRAGRWAVEDRRDEQQRAFPIARCQRG